MSKSIAKRLEDCQRIIDKLRVVEAAARTALEAYEHRFGSTLPRAERPADEFNYTGPIDDEMIALRKTLPDKR